MKKLMIFLAMLLMVSPAFAALSVTGVNVAPGYINTRTTTNMLNLSMVGGANITAIAVSLNGTASDVSAVYLLDTNGSTIALTTTISAKTSVTIPAGYNVSGNSIIIIAINVSNSAALSGNISVNVTSNETDFTSNANVSFTNIPNSTTPMIRDIHANVTISPNYVDTNTTNQTLVYWIIPTGRTPINKTVITIPSGFNFTNISTVQIDGSNISILVLNTTAPNYINITLTPTNSTTNPIKVTFNVNTSLTNVSGLFTSTIEGNGLRAVATDIAGSINVTTQQLIRSAIITPTKLTAFANGTDYWEFSIALNFTANATGMVQFRMANWSNTAGQNISIIDSGCSSSCASLRSPTNASNTVNVTNAYTDSGVSVSNVADGLTFAPILRMIIPSGTAISNTWYTTYDILFRALPA